LHDYLLAKVGGLTFRVYNDVGSPEADAASAVDDGGVGYAELLRQWGQSHQLYAPSNMKPITAFKTWGPLAMAIVSGEWPLLDVKVARENSSFAHIGLHPGVPHGKLVGRYLRSIPRGPSLGLHASIRAATVLHASDIERDLVYQKKQRRGFIDAFDPGYVVACVRGTRTLKSVALLPQCFEDMRELMPRDISETLESYMHTNEVSFPSTLTLERGRVTLDLAAMLGRRIENARSLERDPARSLNYDTSGQHGIETFFIHEETIYDNKLATSEKRDMPLTGMFHGGYGVVDKSFRIIHVVFLDVGPCPILMHLYFASVSIVHTDDGIEAFTIDQVDLIDAFLKRNSSPTNEELAGLIGTFLYPNAMRGIPWNHILDNATQRIVSSLHFYRAASVQMKDITKFLRVSSYRLVIQKQLKQAGHEIEAKQFRFFLQILLSGGGARFTR
jgi:hypothetical protein